MYLYISHMCYFCPVPDSQYQWTKQMMVCSKVLGHGGVEKSVSTTTTAAPTEPPTTAPPTEPPTEPPTTLPPTTEAPTEPPTTAAPTEPPTTAAPTQPPTEAPTTAAPTEPPTEAPTDAPTTAPTTTAAPAPPVPEPRHFDAGSFIGGMVLAVAIIAVMYAAWRFWKQRNDRNYHTLQETVHM
ncbi:unnamed protein product [Meganyctiphanes norvegica]|uniref:Uncharacterized protein n=1 Tax=Meganyctiphanes norvegica TaxID=48144 RepID=A0AAV2QZJ4_MEGNR